MADTPISTGAPALTFSFSTLELRVLMRDGNPWFVAADVCAALDLPNTTRALARLDADEQALISIQGISRGNDQVNIVNEPGLYTLILGSRKPEAKKFKRWVTHEVLPAIRKTGAYVHAPAMRPAISIEQHARLSDAISKACAGWVFNRGDQQHIHNHLRVAFQVASVRDIPADCFDAAMTLVTSKQEACGQFLVAVAEARDWFAREVLGAGVPWTPAVARRMSQEIGRRVILPPKVDWLALAEGRKHG